MPTPAPKARLLWTGVPVVALILAFLPTGWCGYGPKIGAVADAILSPLSGPLSAASAWMGRREDIPTIVGPDVSRDQLALKLKAMENEVYQLMEEKRQLIQQLEEVQAFQREGIGKDIVFKQASVIGQGADPTSRSITIDLGAIHGVREDNAVLSRQNLVGRVVNVGPTSSTVQLLNFDGNRIDVLITPPGQEGREIPFEQLPHLQLTPTGADRFEDRDVDRKVKIRAGDLARLYDRRWPQAVQHRIVGVVVKVQPDPDDALRQRVAVRPPSSLMHIDSVMVLVRKLDAEKQRQAGDSP